jgi:hypothetical protein
MAECKKCGRKLGFWEGKYFGACPDCADQTSNQRAEINEAIDSILLTTETAPNLEIKSRVGIIMADADCSFTVKMVENNNALQFKLRSEAYSIGANAVVGITFNMIETYSATLGVNTFKLIAYGTAVIIENEEGAL